MNRKLLNEPTIRGTVLNSFAALAQSTPDSTSELNRTVYTMAAPSHTSPLRAFRPKWNVLYEKSAGYTALSIVAFFLILPATYLSPKWYISWRQAVGPLAYSAGNATIGASSPARDKHMYSEANNYQSSSGLLLSLRVPLGDLMGCTKQPVLQD
jgi:hypothetical protein